MRHVSRYPLSISLLHWLLAVALIGNLAIGWLLDDHEELIALHKSIGIAILGLASFRIANRLLLRRSLPPSINAPRSPSYLAEKAVHHLLLVLMLAIPILGWLKTNAAGHVANCFGVVSLPTLVQKSRELSQWFGELHALAAYGLAALVGLHVLGAVAHWLMKSENVLPRISPLPVRLRPKVSTRD